MEIEIIITENGKEIMKRTAVIDKETLNFENAEEVLGKLERELKKYLAEKS